MSTQTLPYNILNNNSLPSEVQPTNVFLGDRQNPIPSVMSRYYDHSAMLRQWPLAANLLFDTTAGRNSQQSELIIKKKK